MLTVACVLRSGGRYDPVWVRRLAAGVAAHLPVAHRFVCLSDVTDVPGRIPLVTDWPGWWAKLELFRPGLFEGPVLFFDLDTLIVGDLSEIASYCGGFAMLRDFYRPDGLGSGVLAWMPSEETASIYARFPAMERSPFSDPRGDQAWIARCVSADRLQDLFPGQFVSYKADDCRAAVPPNARVLCFHGQPKQDNCGGWAQAMWEAA